MRTPTTTMMNIMIFSVMQCRSSNVSHNHSAWILYGETGKYYVAIKWNDTLGKAHEHDVREAEGFFFFPF